MSRLFVSCYPLDYKVVILLTAALFCLLKGAAHLAGDTMSYVVNGGFERGADGWNISSSAVRVVDSSRGGKCLEVNGEGGAAQEIFVGHLPKTFTASVDMKATGIKPAPEGGYAYAAVYQLDSHNELVAFQDFAQARTDQDWTRHTFTFEVHPEARIVSLRCGIFRAKGVAWFDNWTLVEGKEARQFTEVQQPDTPSPSAKRVVGIFRQPGFPARGAASSPETIAEILQQAGITTQFLDIAELSDPTRLRPSNFDIIILPYGQSFPAEARDSFIAYLHLGGDFISMGGYAFLNLLLQAGDRYLPEEEVLSRRLNEAMSKENSLLDDGGFEKEGTRFAPIGGKDLAAKWHRSSGACQIVSEHPVEGSYCAEVSLKEFKPGSEEKWDLHLPAKKNRRYRVSAHIRTDNVTGPGFAYLAVYRYGADDRLIKFTDFAQVRGTADWKRYEFDFTPEPGVTTIYIKCGLYQAAGTAWFDDFRLGDISGADPRPMNTSTGSPADGLMVNDTQIGVFDADYPLKRVARVETAPGQTIFPPGIKFGPVKGWAASGVRGYDRSRWIPLLMTYDRFGRPRGSAGSLLINYAGFYRGSAWGYFGVEDRDLFDGKNPMMRKALQRLTKFMMRGVFLRNLTSDFAAYPPLSTVELRVTVENRGATDQQGRMLFSVRHESSGKVLVHEEAPVQVAAGNRVTPCLKFHLPKEVTGLCRVTASLLLGGEVVDSMETGFVALAPPGSVGGLPLRFRNNYLCFGDRTLFLFGCDNYSNVYHSSTQGPLWWAREHAACRDFGFGIYENLQYSNPGYVMKEEDWRRFAGMTQLTQEHGLVFMPGLLIGENVAIGDEKISQQSLQCQQYASRLKETPRLLWYINGDYQIRHEDRETLRRKWNAFLKERYTTLENLKAAWAPDEVPGNFGDLPFPPPNSGRWDAVPQIDLIRFHLKLMDDWNRAHVAAIRAEDKAHPITSEYYSSPSGGIDLRLTIDGQDLSNIGYFDEPVKDIDRLPLKIRWNDLRAVGKSVGLGEYGVKTHPAWRVENGGRGYHIQRTEEEQKQLFMAVAHYAFGMGCSRVQNWCLRDSDEQVFPWGVFYPGLLVPKDVAYIHRNLSLLMRAFEPQDEAPPLTVLICDNMRIGNMERLGIDSVYRAFGALLGLHVDFNVLGDSDAARLPSTTRAIIYPSALCADDASFEALLKWVRSGGMLLTTGGPVYDENRKLTRTERLKQLAGVEWVQSLYSPDQRGGWVASPLQKTSTGMRLPSLEAAPIAMLRPAGGNVLAIGDSGAPVLVQHRVGKGTVFYFADPIELASAHEEALLPLYRWFVEQANISPFPIEPDDPQLHVFAQKTRTGRAYVVFNCRKGNSHQIVTLPTRAGEVKIQVKDRYPAIAGVSDGGEVTLIGGYGMGKSRGETLLDGDCLATAVSLDGLDLRQSEAVMILPFSTGKVSVCRSKSWARPVVILGDIQGGRFLPLERIDTGAGSAVNISLDEDRATLIALVCEKGAERRWGAFLNRWISSPESIRGR